MNVFKFGRGDFFGILIPGAFIVINLILIFYDPNSIFFDIYIPFDFPELFNNTGLLLVCFLVASYIFGFSLRVIDPGKAERIFFIMIWLPLHYFIAASLYLNQINKSNTYSNIRQSILKKKRESFPYIYWFFDEYIEKCPSSYKKFYKIFLLNEYDNKIENIRGKNLINMCKIYIYKNSDALRDELIYCEGLVRLISGMFFGLLLSIILIVIFNKCLVYLLYFYVPILIAFGTRLRSIRDKEVLTIFDAYAFLK